MPEENKNKPNVIINHLGDREVICACLTQHQCRPAGYPGLQALVEDLMKEHDGLTDKTNKQSGGQELLFFPFLITIFGSSHSVKSHHHHNQSHHQPPVKEDAADIIVRDGRLLGAGCHAEWPQEVVNQDVELLDVFSLGLQHAEDDLVPLPHAFSMG